MQQTSATTRSLTLAAAVFVLLSVITPPAAEANCVPETQYRIVKWQTGGCCWLWNGAKYVWAREWQNKWQSRQRTPNCSWTSWQDTGEPEWISCSTADLCPSQASLEEPPQSDPLLDLPPLMTPLEPHVGAMLAASWQDTESCPARSVAEALPRDRSSKEG